MHLNDEPLSLYDVLELTPDATPQEIRSAYLRLKSAYGKDNIAHYSVFSREETDQMLQNVENSYLILSNPEKRRVYDETQGLRPGSMAMAGFSPPAMNLFDSAPMNSAELASLTASTSFTQSSPIHPIAEAALQSTLESALNDIDSVIRNEETWSGPAIRRIREAKRITIEDLSDYTRISRTYLHALEEENYPKLPAVVYVRGFLQQVSRRLKLPVDLVSRQYLDRMRASTPEKN